MVFRSSISLLAILSLFCVASWSDAAPDTLADQMSTSERLARYPWWPTKYMNSPGQFVGSEVCGQCHKDIVASQRQTEMAQTLMPAAESSLRDFLGKTVKVDNFTYEFFDNGKGLSFRTPASGTSQSKPLSWAFGSGAISQVYVTDEGNSYNESHFSYFEPIHGFDLTPAQPNLRVAQPAQGSPSSSAMSAMGRTVVMPEARRCFVCHAANVPGEGPITGFLPGVTCETCHGPGANHTAAARADLPQSTALIFNPGRLRPVDRVDFCGSCHATSIDVQLEGSIGLPSVRFPAYRLQNSACWSNDARIQCTACHNPHKPLSHDSTEYDQRCLTCHLTNTAARPDATHPGKACPTSTKDCSGCHMPRYELPGVHHKFTDHDIRVVKPGQPIPA